MNVSKPVFVSAILLTVLSTLMISQVFSVVADSGNPFEMIWEAISGLEGRVETLEEQSPPPGFLSAPAYDSGWVAFNPGQTVITLEHNLGTRELFVYMVGLHIDHDVVHQFAYGSDSYLDRNDDLYKDWGARWRLSDDNTINVIRGQQDLWWQEIRVYIWVIS